jgi:hypothetical protein
VTCRCADLSDSGNEVTRGQMISIQPRRRSLRLCLSRKSTLYAKRPLPGRLRSNAVTGDVILRCRLCDKSGLVSPIEEAASLRQVERKEVNTHIDRVRGSFGDK